ncbi:MAG: hypothetical protein DI537_33175 [Stutzerimonas stutzeri]|nr:MAG: hypothetical protein DI537_33175 [Stutzerimonas stutzeri]
MIAVNMNAVRRKALTARRFVSLCFLSATTTLAGCASPAAEQRVAQTTAAFDDLTSSKMATDFELLDKRGLTGAALQAEEKRVADAFGPVCEKGYVEGLVHGTDLARMEYEATGSRHRAYELPAFARNLDRQFGECLRSFGATGRTVMILSNGSHMSVPDFMERLVAAAAAKGAADGQARLERQQSAAVLAVVALGIGAAASGGTNPNQTYVGNYMRRDGTVVQGHWRTMPNSSCWDNLSGC